VRSNRCALAGLREPVTLRNAEDGTKPGELAVCVGTQGRGSAGTTIFIIR
jgi:hypothetical protein